MKYIVFVPLARDFIPWARSPGSFPNEISHASHYFGFFLRWFHLSNSHISPSMTDPNHLHNVSNGNFLNDGFLVVDYFIVMSIYANITSCANVLVLQILDHVLFASRFS